MNIYEDQLRQAFIKRAKLKRQLIDLDNQISILVREYSREAGWKYPLKFKEAQAEIFGHNFGETK